MSTLPPGETKVKVPPETTASLPVEQPVTTSAAAISIPSSRMFHAPVTLGSVVPAGSL